MATGVSPITVNVVTTSITATATGNNGGYLATIKGSGFPLDTSKITISVCSKNVIVKSVRNTEVIFVMPSCDSIGAQNVAVSVGSKSATLQFTYTNASATAPMIASVSPSSANPAMKGKLTVTGTGFGSDATQLTAFLSNSTGKIYQLQVLSVVDT